MWIKYNRILQGNQWIHPDFANDGRTQEKHLSPSDNTLFLANTTKTDFIDEMATNKVITNIDGVDVETEEVINKTNYARFNIIEIPENMVKSKKQEFKIGRVITKGDFLNKMTFEERLAVCNYENKLVDVAKVEAMKTLWNMFDNFIMINLDDERFVSDFVQVIGWCDLITPTRIIEIIS